MTGKTFHAVQGQVTDETNHTSRLRRQSTLADTRPAKRTPGHSVYAMVQMLALVVSVVGALARAVLVALHLRQGVPPQVLGLVGRIDDGVREAIVAVEVLGQLPQGVGFGEQVALVVVAGLPGAAVRVGDLGHQPGQVVVLVSDRAPERVGFFEQVGELVVLEGELVAVRQAQANHVAVLVQLNSVALAAVVAAGDDAVVFVVTNLQLTAQHIGGPTGAGLQVVTEVVVLAIAGPVLDHAWRAAQGVAVADHQAAKQELLKTNHPGPSNNLIHVKIHRYKNHINAERSGMS